MSLPFDGAISAFYEKDAPDEIREALRSSGKKDILSDTYPYEQRMDREAYDAEMEMLQLELVRLQADVRETGKRLVVVFAFFGGEANSR